MRTETSKSLDRTEFETSPLFASARKFELEYLDAAEKILAKGPEEKLQDPQDDEILVEMKNIYCINKTREV